MATAACGGSTKDQKSSGTLTYTPSSSAASSATMVAVNTPPPPPVNMPAPPVVAVSSAPALQIKIKPPPPKPPGMDMSADQRDGIVNGALTTGASRIAANDGDGAIQQAMVALAADETNVPAMVLLARGNYIKNYDDKVEAILQIAEKEPGGDQNAELFMLLGLIYDRAQQDRSNDALTAYETAVRLKPSYLPALENVGTIYLKRHRYADAVSTYEKVVGLDKQNPKAHMNLGTAYRGKAADTPSGSDRDDLLKKAELELKTALSLNPHYAQADFNLGVLYLDASPFPGYDTLVRLDNAKRYFNQYKTEVPKATGAVDDYLAAATKAYDKEQKRQKAHAKDTPPAGAATSSGAP
jgi:tetratricopeptide (TPR) repeat protein